MRLAFEADREARFAGAAPVMIQTVASDPNARVAYPGRDSHDYMMSEAERCPSWVNEITLRSLELARTYEPGAYITRIAPTPMLMIVATDDALTPSDLQQEAFNEAYQPKSSCFCRADITPSIENISTRQAPLQPSGLQNTCCDAAHIEFREDIK